LPNWSLWAVCNKFATEFLPNAATLALWSAAQNPFLSNS